MILTIIAILLVLWFLGLLIHIGGAFIHLLLLIAVIVFIWDHLINRKKV